MPSNSKGNPNHDAKTGEFTTGPGGGVVRAVRRLDKTGRPEHKSSDKLHVPTGQNGRRQLETGLPPGLIPRKHRKV